MTEITMTPETGIARTPDMIAGEINRIKEHVRSTVLSSAIQIGRRLLEAKRLVPAGSWGEWLETNVNYSQRTAQNMMALASEYGERETQALADLSYTKAVMLLSVPRDERAEFADAHDLEAMSTRELQAEIARLKEEKAALQISMDELTAAGSVESDVQAENERLKKDLAGALAGIDTAKDVDRENREKIKNLRVDIADRDKRLKAADERAQAAEKDAADSKRALEDALKNAKAPIIQQVTPPEVERELNDLRARLTRSQEEQALRAGFDLLKSSYGRLQEQLRALAAQNEPLARLFRAAFAKGMRLMAEGMEQNAVP